PFLDVVALRREAGAVGRVEVDAVPGIVRCQQRGERLARHRLGENQPRGGSARAHDALRGRRAEWELRGFDAADVDRGQRPGLEAGIQRLGGQMVGQPARLDLGGQPPELCEVDLHLPPPKRRWISPATASSIMEMKRPPMWPLTPAMARVRY